jgi:hypothetical protein
MMNLRMIRDGKVIMATVVDRDGSILTLDDGTIIQFWEGTATMTRPPEAIMVPGVDIDADFPKVCEHCNVSIFPNMSRDVRPFTMKDGTKGWIGSCNSEECLKKHSERLRKLSRDPNYAPPGHNA